MAKTYTAEFEGKIVGKRTTKDRSYSHAIVVVPSREYHRKAAYEHQGDKTDHSNFNYYTQVAEGRYRYGQTNEEMIKASGLIDGGFDAYVERVRQGMIKRFEDKVTGGDFEPRVEAWASRLDLAQKAAAGYRRPWNERVEIVPAVEQAKRPKAKA